MGFYLFFYPQILEVDLIGTNTLSILLLEEHAMVSADMIYR